MPDRPSCSDSVNARDVAICAEAALLALVAGWLLAGVAFVALVQQGSGAELVPLAGLMLGTLVAYSEVVGSSISRQLWAVREHSGLVRSVRALVAKVAGR